MKEMNKDKRMTERILSHALKIIYLLTGEEYAIVKKNSPHTSIHQLTEECDIDGDEEILWNPKTLKTFGMPGNRSSGFQENNVDTVSEKEDETDEKDILQVTIHSELCAGFQDDDDVYTVSVKEEEDSESEDIEIQQRDSCAADGSISMNTAGKHKVSFRHKQVIPAEKPSHTHRNVLSINSLRMSGKLEPHAEGVLTKPQMSTQRQTMQPDNAETSKKACNDEQQKNNDCREDSLQYNSQPMSQNVHTGEKPFSCTECRKSFSQKSCLVRHQKVHTGEKIFVCSDCGKSCMSKSHLVIHQRMHTGEKPYVCSDCGKCFSQKAGLVRHQIIHTGEKPFECSDCGRCFNDKTCLVRHQRIHTGENRFACSECGKLFVQHSNLIRHGRIHSKEKYSRSSIIRSLWEKGGGKE